MRAARNAETLPPPAAVASGGASLAGLGNRFVSLFARRLPREAFAAEVVRIAQPALHAVAVAILGYESRRDRLVLLASEGLNADAKQALGGGDTCAWDIPMRGLRNRRISVITGAHQNPFVPRALSNVSPRGLSIASLPIHHDLDPAGIMLVFVTGGRALGDSQLQMLSQALRVCAPGIRDSEGDAARGAGPAAQPENVEATIAKLVAAGAIIDPAAASAALTPPAREATPVVAPSGPPPDDLVARVQSLERELSKAHEELEGSGRRIRQLTMSNNALARERDGLAQQVAEIETGQGTELAEVRAELAATQERLLAVEAERTRIHRLSEGRRNVAQQSISTLEQERTALETRASNAEATVAEVQTLLAAVLDERDRLNSQLEAQADELRLKQESLQRYQGETVQERVALEADRDGWKEEANSARSQLADRSEQLAATERELRSTVVARDGMASQLAAARAELERLTALSDELSNSSAQVEASRATTAAENASLRRALDEERTARMAAEKAMRAELLSAERQIEQLTGAGDTLRGELAERVRALAERDLQITALRQEVEAGRRSLTGGQESISALRSEIATLSAQVEQTAAERQQLLDERATLRASLTELRQRSTEADVAHVTALGELQAELDSLRRQGGAAESDRAAVSERLQRAVAEGQDLARRLADAQRRSEELGEVVAARDNRLAELGAEREQLESQRAALEGQLQAARESLERQQSRAAHERSSFEAQRTVWEEHSTAAQSEMARRTENLLQLERDLRAAVVARDTAVGEIEALREDHSRLAAQLDGLRDALTRREGERDAANASAAALRNTLATERAARDEAERAVRAELTAARAEVERRSSTAAALRKDVDDQSQALAAREAAILDLQREVEVLRQQTADRDVLATQASSLGQRVVELEQQLAAARAEAARAQDQTASEWEQRLVSLEQELAAVRGEAAQAERQRASVAEELEALRRLQSQGEVVSDRKLATLRDAVDRLTEERRRLETQYAERNAEFEAQRATLADLESTLELLRTERSEAQAQGQDLAQQLGEVHRRLEEQSAQLRDRELAVDAAAADRSKLSAQLAKLNGQLRASQEAIETLEGRSALDRAALEAERDRWREQADAARAELDSILATADEATQNAAQIAAARSAAESELSALRRTLEGERSARQSQEAALRAELSGIREESERRSGELMELRTQLEQRDAELVALLQEHDSGRQSYAQLEQAQSRAQAELEAMSQRLAAATAEVERAQAERAELEAQAGSAQASQGEEMQALRQDLQSTRTRFRALENEKSLLESALGEHQQRTRDLAAAHASSVGELQRVADDLRKQIAELNAGRSNLLERAQRAELALSLRDREAGDGLQERDVLAERCSQLEQQLAAADSRRGEIEVELTRIREEAESLRAVTADRGALAEHADELGRRMADLEQQVASLRGEVTRSERQRAAMAEELEAAHALRGQLVDAAEAEQTRLRERLQQLTEERKRIETIQTQQQTELEASRAALSELRASFDQAREERLQLEQSGHDLRQEIEASQRRVEELATQLREREAVLEAAAVDRKRLQEAVRAAESTAEMLAVQHGADAPTPADDRDLSEGLVRSAVEIEEEDIELVIERSAPLNEVLGDVADSAEVLADEEPAAAAAAEPVRELFLLDVGKRAEEASAALRGAGFEVNVAAPIEQTVADLRQRALSCVMLNLAAGPQAWRTLKALREDEATAAVPILAYIMPPDGAKGFCFGRAEFGAWPIDPELLITRLTWLKPKLKRLLAVSADVDGMGKLRDPLAKAGVSTSIVLDGKQALEFTTIVAPEAAVLHLSPQTIAVARAIAGIRTQESTADLPLLLLLDKAPPREEVFLAATVRELTVKGTFTFNKLPAEIARLIA